MASSLFNKEQQQAIKHKTGPAMVIAGPGSGKTTVITNRVRQLIDSGTARPEEILVITFTVAAAGEMKERYLKLCKDSELSDSRNNMQPHGYNASASPGSAIYAALSNTHGVSPMHAAISANASVLNQTAAMSKDYSKVTFGTFHSVFYQFLKRIPGYEGLKLAETRECIDILRSVVNSLQPGNRYTSDYYTYLLNRISVIKNTEKMTSACYESDDKAEAVKLSKLKSSQRKTQATADKDLTHVHHGNAALLESPSDSFIYRVFNVYSREMLRQGLIDFDDMLVLFDKCLHEDRDFRDGMRRRFKFIMIDEFQDINRIQFDAVRTLAEPLNNIFVVGDDDQSIYAFRGSDPSIMLSYKLYYPDAAFIELFTNYRSSKTIIKAASRLIAHNKERYDKQFTAVKELKLPPERKSFRTQAEEAAFIAQDIRRLPEEIKTVGILYRTHRTGTAVKQAIDKLVDAAEGLPADDGGLHGAAGGLPAVSLMTFHASKGLEFDAVYIISANEGITPSKSAGKSGIEEERRLFYVAMTRAKHFLHISDTRYIYNKSQNRSRFVREAFGIIAAADDIFRKI